MRPMNLFPEPYENELDAWYMKTYHPAVDTVYKFAHGTSPYFMLGLLKTARMPNPLYEALKAGDHANI